VILISFAMVWQQNNKQIIGNFNEFIW